MPTRNVVLTEHQSSLVESLVASGRYQNASEVLRDGLRLVEVRNAEEVARLQALRDAAQMGAADFEAGRFQTLGSPAAIRTHVAALVHRALSQPVSTEPA